MAGKKAKKPKGNGLARPEHPYGTVGHVVDTITAMRRRSQISQRQALAAERYRDAFDAITASLRGTLAKDGSSVGNGSGKTPSRPEMEAADVLNTVDKLLGVVMRIIIEEVVGIGRTIEETANMLYRGRASARERDAVGKMLQLALDMMADEWWPSATRSPYRAFMLPGAKPTDTGSGALERGHVIHATSRRIFDKTA